MNNESKKNALPVEGRALLASIMTELSTDPELRCVVLTGVKDNFIGGANIGQMADFPDHVVAELGSKTTHHACDSIRRVPVPVIARIEGYCLGAGMEIATSCDMRVASTTAKFGMPEVKYGVPSGMEACLIPRLTGWGKAMELVFTGEIISAEEAYHFNYVEKLVAPEDLDAQTAVGSGGVSGSVPTGTFSADSIVADLRERSVRLDGNARLRMVPGKLRVPQ